MESPQPILDYATPAEDSGGLGRLIRLRFAFLTLYVVGVSILLYLLDPGRGDLPLLLGASAIIVVLQLALLSGAPQLPRRRPRRRRSMLLTLLAGSILVGLLTSGLIASLISAGELLHLFEHESFADLSNLSRWCLFLLPWLLWLALFTMIWASHWISLFGKIYKTLIAGTVLELLITIPIDARIRRQTQCYCGEGTFVGLAIGISAAIATFGPGITILFLARRRQRG